MWTVLIRHQGIIETTKNLNTFQMNLIVKGHQIFRCGSIEIIWQEEEN